MPNSQGCNIVYHLLVVRLFKTFEQDIDHATGKLGELTRELANQGSSVLDKTKNNIISSAITNSATTIFTQSSQTSNNNNIINDNINTNISTNINTNINKLPLLI
jgi:hypothetical protein